MTHHDDDQIPGEPESALAMPVLDIDREFITETTNLLTRFAPDASVRRADAFAAAYRAERGILPIESDDSTLNDSSAVVRTRDIHALLRRMSSTKRAYCITAAPPLPANFRCDFVHPTQLRHITVGEQKRLMEFPDWFLLAGPIEDRWRQTGNAVIPSMAELIGRKIIEASKAGRPETRAVKARAWSSAGSVPSPLFGSSPASASRRCCPIGRRP